MKALLAVLISTLYATLRVSMATAETLTFYTEHFPPYNYVAAGKVTGLNTELLRLACEKTQLVCHFELYPWRRAYEKASKDPNGALFSTSRSSIRESSFKWVGPLAHSKANLYRLKDRPGVNPLTLEDAKSYVIGVAHGDVYEQYLLDKGFAHNKNLIGFVTKANAVNLFLQGKVDLLIASDLILPVWLAQHGVNIRQIEPIVDLSDIEANYLALNPAISDSTAEKLQLALDKLMSSELYQQLKATYMQPHIIVE